MIEQDWQKRALRTRRERRDLPRQGYAMVDDSRGVLASLDRGDLLGHRIEEVRIGADGKTLWVKVSK